MKTSVSGYVYAALSALSFGLSPVLIKKGLSALDAPWTGLVVAMGTTTLLYLCYLLFSRFRWRSLSQLDRRTFVFLAITGLLVGLGTLSQWLALQLTPVVLAFPLIQTAPLFTIIFSLIFLRDLEQINVRVWFGGLLITLGGVVLVVASKLG